MRLKKLIDKVERIINNSKYQDLKKFWNNFYDLKETNKVPTKITLTMVFFAENLNINLIDHYKEPKKNILKTLYE